MELLTFPVNNPCLYWTLAFGLSLYYGIRGIIIQRHRTHNENIDLQKNNLRQWSLFDRIFVQCAQDFFFNFVCAFAGFIAIFVEGKIFLKISDLSNIGGGTAAVIVFLSLLAILGVSGALPFILLHGKIFGR